MLTRDEAVRSAAIFAQLLNHPGGRTPSFQIAAHEALARWLAANAPGGLEFSGEVSMGVSQMLTSEAMRDANRAFLARHAEILAEFDGSLRYHVPDCGMAPGPLFDSLSYTARERVEAWWGFTLLTSDQAICITSSHDMRDRVLEPGQGELVAVVPSLSLVPGRYRISAVLIDARNRQPYAQRGWDDHPQFFDVAGAARIELNAAVHVGQLTTIAVDWQ